MKKTGIELIAAERVEHVKKHGRTVDFDKQFNNVGQLIRAVRTLTIVNLHPKVTPQYRPDNWDPDLWDRMCAKSYKDRLVIAAALIAAEIDRISE